MRCFVWGLRLSLLGSRLRSLLWLLFLASLLVVAAALVERGHDPLRAPERSIDLVQCYLLPLLCFATVTVVGGGKTLAANVWPLARYGCSRRLLVVGLSSGAATFAALASAFCMALAVGVSYGELPGRGADLLTSTWIAALGSATYTWLFMLMWNFAPGRRSSRWSRRRVGKTSEPSRASEPRGALSRWRYAPLVADFVLGGSTGALGVFWPRAHLRNLLAQGSIAGLSQQQSTGALWLLALTCLAFSLWRCRD